MSERSKKLKGPYVACVTQCGQPEPCFGCDPGDYAEDICPICNEHPRDFRTRNSPTGNWCMRCQCKFDDIDWGAEK